MISKVKAQPQTLIQRIAFNRKASQLKLLNLALVISGVILLSALAQVSIPLPFTPVPITGQSLGVLLIALFYGSRLATSTTLSYLGLGMAGLPIFAEFKSGLVFPSAGYLVGMLAASYVVGLLADRGWTKNIGSTLLASLIGKAIIFSFGLVGLSFFVPMKSLLVMGFYPFVPGLFIKAFLATAIVSGVEATNVKK
jgi:biotin transport system substrate-specific component